ncbi:flagellar basal body P-ring protein FlgA [Salmonella enterica subsp. arizonae]|uniref:Flagellar basal body P-ring protein FlgA n=1 Tax=Salmonella enterica subsp. arizonae TaxID=59203 RepID=A0A379S6H6_SALER|nr:flagellar basal body P-ring protein FlgA [Salmonella enterica subsp. arizonae]
MQTLKRGFAVAALLFSPLTMAQDINAQLTTWFSSVWLALAMRLL